MPTGWEYTVGDGTGITVRDGLFVGNRWCTPTTDAVVEVVSPITGRVISRVAEAAPADVDAMVAVARESFEEGRWRRTPPVERGALLRRVADMLERRKTEICRIVCEEMGSPPGLAAMLQVTPALAVLRFYADLATGFPWQEFRRGDFGVSVVSRQPVGVVAAITAWNVPIYLNVAKLAPALLAGCSVVLKPAPGTPGTALWIAELFAEAGLPEGVLSVATGGDGTGEHLVAHEQVDKVSFTGSTAVGRRIGEITGRQLKRCSLELGGKSAAIVMDDADLESAAGSIVFSAMMNSGQACISQNRVLAPRARYEEVVAALVEAVSAMPVGDPRVEGTVFGPVAGQRQKETVQRYIRTGIEEGARLAYGGAEVPGLPPELAGGAFVQPTVFADVDNSMTIAREEIFGPVLEVIAYDDTDDAVRIAEDSEFGLAGAVYSADPEAALAVAQRLRTGTAGINWYAFDACAPFGGFKSSGIGRENGREGLEGYCELQSVLMPPGWEPDHSTR